MRTSVTFGEAPFTMQVPLSGGVAARIAQEQAELKRNKLKDYESAVERARMQSLARECVQELLSSDDAKRLPGVATYILNRVAPILPKAWEDTWVQENCPYDYTLLILRNILIPESEVTVEQAFEIAGVEEAKTIMTFFTENAVSKTSDGGNKTNGSRRTKKSKTARR